MSRSGALKKQRERRNDTRNEILFPISRHVNACIFLGYERTAGLSKLLGIARWTVEGGTHLTSISTAAAGPILPY